MRSPLPPACLLALLLIPVIAAGGQSLLTGGAPGIGNQSLPLLPNVSFADRTLAAQDWYEQGFALTNREQYDEALLAYERALSYDRSLLNAWYYEGDALFRLGRYEEALLAFSNATAVDPDFVDAYFYESRVYGQLGRLEEQRDALQRGLEAADRKVAAQQGAGVHPGTAGREPASEPLLPVLALLGTGMAIGLRAFLRRGRNS